MKTIELLKKGMEEIAEACTEEQTASFMTYLTELKRWNRTYNLTALRKDEDIIIKHFLDSLLYLKAVPGNALRLADAGSGAGFPGIPLKIARPDMHITLIESSRKKAAFLRHIIRLLRLSEINVLEQRLEQLGKGYEKFFDIIVTRATFNICDFMKMACLYLNDEGTLVLNKGPKASEELEALRASPFKNALIRHIKYPLPFIKAERNLIVISCKMNP